jgi:hypothetical protein
MPRPRFESVYFKMKIAPLKQIAGWYRVGIAINSVKYPEVTDCNAPYVSTEDTWLRYVVLVPFVAFFVTIHGKWVSTFRRNLVRLSSRLQIKDGGMTFLRNRRICAPDFSRYYNQEDRSMNLPCSENLQHYVSYLPPTNTSASLCSIYR